LEPRPNPLTGSEEVFRVSELITSSDVPVIRDRVRFLTLRVARASQPSAE